MGENSSSTTGKRQINLSTNHSGLNKSAGEDDLNFQCFIPSLKEMLAKAIRESVPNKSLPLRQADVTAKSASAMTIAVEGVFLLPFIRDAKFVGREDILQKIETLVSGAQEQACVALVGLGGIGYDISMLLTMAY